MQQNLHRRGVLQAGLALGVACVVPAARACEFYTPNLTILHPWTRASEAGATSAIVSMTFKDVTETDRLIGAQTPVADGAVLAGGGAGPLMNFLIHEGQTTSLSEAGVHLLLTGLQFPMEVGRQYPLTLVFAKAGPVRAQLTVDYQRFR
jgi:periplasmic copper chaperone A